MRSTALLVKVSSLPVVLGLVQLLVTAGASRADDRALFRSNTASPYVFNILDTSSSMHSFPDSGAQPPGDGSDPLSREYIVKSAIYEVVKGLDPNMRFGFAHFNQENLRYFRKLWLYRRKAGTPNPPWWTDLGMQHPQAGVLSVFGEPKDSDFTRESCGNPDTDFSDSEGSPGKADANPNIWPKLGHAGNTNTSFFYRFGSTTYEMIYQPVAAASWGKGTMDVAIRVRRCAGPGSYDKTATVTFETWYYNDAEHGANVWGNPGFPFVGAGGEALGFDFIEAGDGYSNDGYDSTTACTSGAEPGGGSRTYWDPNNTNATGSGAASQVAFPTFVDPLNRDPGNRAFDRGDVLPWDWVQHPISASPAVGFEFDSRQEILYRLAPNTAVPGEFDLDANGNPIPDFRFARYFENVPVTGACPGGGSSKCIPLRAQFARFRPITPGNGTPLAGSLNDFRHWYEQWEPTAQNETTGDPNWGCRERFLILLSDGKESCNGNTTTAARDIYDMHGIRIFAVGFGNEVGANDLDDIANEGGTGTLDKNSNGQMDCTEFTYPVVDAAGNPVLDGGGDPMTSDFCWDRKGDNNPSNDVFVGGVVLASNRNSLVNALRSLFDTIIPEPTSFASAGVPQAQTESQESVFLGSFLPIEGSPTWPGSLRHFIRPIPLTLINGKFLPDESKTCDLLDPKVSCFAWEAQQQMLGLGTGAVDQVPADVTSATELDMAIGNGIVERRLFYAQEPPLASATATYVGLARHLLEQPTTTPDKYDLWDGLEIPFVAGDVPSETAAESTAFQILRKAVVEKTALSPLDPSQTLTWIMGDVFHSDPTTLGPPNRFEYMSSNLENDGPCRGSGNNFDFTKNGYRCFFEQHRLRRKVLFVGTNDAQLHAFDAGFFESKIVLGDEKGEFTPGTGQELFAYVPRVLLPRLRELADAAAHHEFSLDGTVLIDDVFMDPNHVGAPDPDERIWRSVLIGGLREGGVGYHALDVTQPDSLTQGSDPLKTILPEDQGNYVPSCIKNYTAAACGPNPYATVLWEYRDLDNNGLAADEDGNGNADLGYTWSQPNSGRIEVCTEATFPCPTDKIDNRYVAIFGGGNCAAPGRPGPQCPDQVGNTGNFLYMVDIETGQAIYKRAVIGSVPSEPAAVDTDRDGILDTIYFGTTTGLLYKVDISAPVEVKMNLTVPGGERIEDASWEPFVIFDTDGLPMYYPPSVIFVASKGRYALAWTTGDREHLWRGQPRQQRFYALLDTGFNTATGFGEGTLHGVPATDTTPGDLLLDPTLGTGSIPGYFIELTPGERGITRVFTLAGISIFSTFIPESGAVAGTCRSNGVSNVYTVFTASGNPLGTSERFRAIDGFVSNPFTEQSATKTVDKDGDGQPDPGPTSDDLTDELRSIMETIKSQMPSQCRFSNVTINVKAIRSDTGVEFIAPIPVCMIEKNWKEF